MVALLFDGIIAAPKLLDLVPVLDFLTIPVNFMVGMLVSVWAWLSFYVWFKFHGITFLGVKRIMAFPLAMVIKVVPFLGLIPAWTAAVLVLFSTTRAEELLEKAGPLGTIASKALAAKTQGGLSLANTQKSEQERVDKQEKKDGNKGNTQNRLDLRSTSATAATGGNTTEGETEERPKRADSSAMPAESAYNTGTGTVAGDVPPKPQPKQNTGDIGAQPIFRQTQSESVKR